MKKNADFRLLKALSTNLISHLEKISIDVIVPIPAHWLTLWKRGFNTPSVIAHHIAQALDKPVYPLLKKTKRTQPQHQLDKQYRKYNIKNCFAVEPATIPFNSTIVLIDDVATTMNTINEASRVLQKQGYTNIYAATIAKTAQF